MKLPRDEARLIFGAIKENAPYLTFHFRFRAGHRGFTMEDVFEVADNGIILKSSPKYNEEHDDWTYTIVGKDIDGIRIVIVFALESDAQVKLITGYKGRKRR